MSLITVGREPFSAANVRYVVFRLLTRVHHVFELGRSFGAVN